MHPIALSYNIALLYNVAIRLLYCIVNVAIPTSTQYCLTVLQYNMVLQCCNIALTYNVAIKHYFTMSYLITMHYGASTKQVCMLKRGSSSKL